MLRQRDIKLDKDHPDTLLLDKHIAYLRTYAEDRNSAEQLSAEHLRVCGFYWGLNALDLMGQLPTNSKEIDEITSFIQQCQHKEGGFGGGIGQDPHLVPTLSAIQVLVIFKRFSAPYINIESCINYIKSMQQSDGCFFGDKWGEVDTRFVFCALASLKLMDRLSEVNVDKAVEFIMKCHNQIDGGFGSKPGSESHAAYVYCSVGSLSLANRLDLIDHDHLGEWLSERQLPSGGLNGRPEKLPDLCYTWWCLSSLRMINRLHWIDHGKLLQFVFACQDKDNGGFSDRPGNYVDPYHTVFGLAGISLMVHNRTDTEDPNLESTRGLAEKIRDLKCQIKNIDPVFCMCADKIEIKSSS
ncbi:Geranylgeranyl transferase type-2 subunit beta, partial [Fragariocoptes setiger]